MGEAFAIRALYAGDVDAFAALVERHNGIFGGCWCIFFHPDCAGWSDAGLPLDVHLH